jgi:DNA-binding response OmpR family regulator
MTSRGTCLVVEDDEDIAGLLELILSQAGFTVRVERTGTTGIQAAASITDLTLVTLDLGLPDLIGTEVARKLRTFTSVPILVITAFTVIEDELAAMAAGADAFMLKPFRPAQIRATIDELCPCREA